MRNDLAVDALTFMVLTVGFWFPLGNWCVQVVGAGKLPNSWHLSVSLGMGMWGMLILFLGLVGLLYPTLLVGLAILLFLCLGFPGWPKSNREGFLFLSKQPLIGRLFTAPFVLLSVIFLIIAFASALAPETSFDGLNVHLSYARASARAHRISFDSNNWSSVMPALPLMGYVTAFLFSGITLAKLINPLCYLLCGAWIFSMMKRWHGTLHGIVSAALFWSYPIAAYEAGTSMIELPLTLFSAVSVLSFLEWSRREEQAFLRLSAMALAFAIGCKYHAVFWVLPIAAGLTAHTFVAGRRTVETWIRSVSVFAAFLSVLALPWLVRAWHYTGNPVFPAANGIFHSKYFTVAMENASRTVYANEGIGHSLLALARLPWTVSFHPGSFHGSLGAVFFVGVVAAVIRRKTRELVYGLLFAGAFFYQWAVTAQEIRYLLPLVPLLCVIATVGILGSESPEIARPRFGRGMSRKMLRIGTVGALLSVFILSVMNLPLLYPRWVHEWTYWHGYLSPIPYLMGRQSREEYLRRDVPSIEVYNYLNAKGTSRDRVLLLNDSAQFYAEVPTLYSFTVEAEEIMLQETEAGVLRKMLESHITHVLLNYNGMAPLSGVAPRRGAYIFLDRGFQERYLEVVLSRNNVVLYRVRA